MLLTLPVSLGIEGAVAAIERPRPMASIEPLLSGGGKKCCFVIAQNTGFYLIKGAVEPRDACAG